MGLEIMIKKKKDQEIFVFDINRKEGLIFGNAFAIVCESMDIFFTFACVVFIYVKITDLENGQNDSN